MALPSEHRLSNGKIISMICKKGDSIRTPFFRIVFLPAHNSVSKSVVVVSKKKYDKNAVSRNSIRRRINGVLQEKMNFFFAEKKFLLVFFPNTEAKKVPHPVLEKNIQEALQKISNWTFTRKKLPRKKIILKK